MKKLTKLITFSILFIILLLPASCSTWVTIESVFGKSNVNQDYVNSSFYTTNDEIGYYTDWCKKNNYGGRKAGSEKDRLSECVDAEYRLDSAITSTSVILTIIILPVFLFYLIFYIKWLRRNYFPNVDKNK